jgi:hypothetical protein
MSDKITLTAFDVIRDPEGDLVVRAFDMDEGHHTLQLDQKLYEDLYGVEFPIDITITSDDDDSVIDVKVHRAQLIH